MGRINGWKREVWHSSLDDEEVQQEVEKNGRAVIAAWRHEDRHTKLVHIYEPGTEREFKVELKDDEIELEEEGQYPRKAGGKANKDLMRRHPSTEYPQ